MARYTDSDIDALIESMDKNTRRRPVLPVYPPGLSQDEQDNMMTTAHSIMQNRISKGSPEFENKKEHILAIVREHGEYNEPPESSFIRRYTLDARNAIQDIISLGEQVYKYNGTQTTDVIQPPTHTNEEMDIYLLSMEQLNSPIIPRRLSMRAKDDMLAEAQAIRANQISSSRIDEFQESERRIRNIILHRLAMPNLIRTYTPRARNIINEISFELIQMRRNITRREAAQLAIQRIALADRDRPVDHQDYSHFGGRKSFRKKTRKRRKRRSRKN